MRRRFLASIATVAISTIATILVLEVALKLLGFGSEPLPSVPVGYRVTEWGFGYDPARPNEFINTAGNFDIEQSRERTPHTFRVATLGDSFLGLARVEMDQQVFRVLEAELHSAMPQPPEPEVLNFSVTGYGTANQLLLFEHYVEGYAPDLVLVFFTVSNDARNNSTELQPLSEGAAVHLPGFVLAEGELLPQQIPAVPGAEVHYQSEFTLFLARHSLLYRMTTIALQRAAGATEPRDSLGALDISLDFLRPTPSAASQAAWDVTEALFARLRDSVEESGAALAVVVVPTSWDFSPTWRSWLEDTTAGSAIDIATLDFDKPYRDLEERLDRLGIPVIDVRPSFRAALALSAEPDLYDTSAHWSHRGHALVARHVAQSLIDLGLVPTEE